MNKKIIFFIIAVLCLAFPSAYAQQETSCTRKVLVQARGDRAAVSAWGLEPRAWESRLDG